MSIPTQQEYFAKSKCDRCGKAQSRRNQEIGDLFTLPHEWGEPYADQGSFCQSCLDRYNPDEWAAWLKINRPWLPGFAERA